MARLIATQDLRYAGAELVAGEAFETASDADARVLKLIGKARDPDAHEPPQEQPAADLLGRAETAEDERRSPGGKTGGRYKRRDVRAEG